MKQGWDIFRKRVGEVVFSARSGELGLAALRIFSGLSMALAHGWGKMLPSERFIEGVGRLGFPWPTFFAHAAGYSEFIGGLLLSIGLATRPSAFFIMVTMLTAGFLSHADDPFGRKEKAFLYAVIMLVFLIRGGGRYSVDRLWRKNKEAD
jgi:putative oxidoreductase